MIKKILLLVTFFLGTTVLIANSQKTDMLALLSASSIYDLKSDRLKIILTPFLKKDSGIKAFNILKR